MGNVYALHSSPLAITDTITLDNSYISLLEQIAHQEKKRFKALAELSQRILEGISLNYGCQDQEDHFD